jgi:hypothetical protein
MAGNHKSPYLFVRPLPKDDKTLSRLHFSTEWRSWKCWVATTGVGYRAYSRRQGPATIAFNGELYWSREFRDGEGRQRPAGGFVQNERE